MLRLALAQINSTVGDLDSNYKKIKKYIDLAKEWKADLIAFPELAITGYPPEDLLLVGKFVEENINILRKLSKQVQGISVIVGFVEKMSDKLFNSATFLAEGEIKGIYHKMLLPNYGVFDEKRYFHPGDKPVVWHCRGIPFGISICEDIWHKEGPTVKQKELGAKFSVVINASPYHIGKGKEREEIVANLARENDLYIAYVNLVGGQDELVFDGQSFVVDRNGKIIAKANPFEEDLLLVDIPIAGITEDAEKPHLPDRVAVEPEQLEEVYKALILGLRDYVRKNGFTKVIIGLSGGIDSSLTAVIAVDALGKENVTGIYMPSRFSSRESFEDAQELAKNLGIKFFIVPIDNLYEAYLSLLAPYFKELHFDATEENLQARIRGNILMAFSNKFRWLVLTTGNKSEMSTGYATLYGDMAGGFNVLKDVYKTMVYQLARYRNNLGEVIPMRVLEKEPSAELRPNQRDKDALPPYEVLDPILKAYIEENKDLEEIVEMGYEEGLARRVIDMVDRNEYKRRQAPPGIKITHRAFGKDRRMPITSGYRR